MKKIKTLLLFFVVGLFLFIGINSNASTISSDMSIQSFIIGGSSTFPLD